MSGTKKFNASQVRNTVALNDRTKETVWRLISERYQTLKWFQEPEKMELINALLNMGMTTEADELISKT